MTLCIGAFRLDPDLSGPLFIPILVWRLDSQRRAWSLRLGQMAIVTTAAETILECDSHTQMHVTNTAAICI